MIPNIKDKAVSTEEIQAVATQIGSHHTRKEVILIVATQTNINLTNTKLISTQSINKINLTCIKTRIVVQILSSIQNTLTKRISIRNIKKIKTSTSIPKTVAIQILIITLSTPITKKISMISMISNQSIRPVKGMNINIKIEGVQIVVILIKEDTQNLKKTITSTEKILLAATQIIINTLNQKNSIKSTEKIHLAATQN